MFKKQHELLKEFLNTCTKSIQYVCSKYTKQLSQKYRAPAVIDKETYTNFTIEYSLHGAISRFLRRRMRGVETAGLWNWWSQLIRSQYFAGDINQVGEVSQRVSVNGNVLIPIYLLISGLGISAFCLEAWRKIAFAMGRLAGMASRLCMSPIVGNGMRHQSYLKMWPKVTKCVKALHHVPLSNKFYLCNIQRGYRYVISNFFWRSYNYLLFFNNNNKYQSL